MSDDDSLSQEALDALLAELGDLDSGDQTPMMSETNAQAELQGALASTSAPAAVAAPPAPQASAPSPSDSSSSPLNLVSFDGDDDGESFDGFERIQDIPLEITVELGRTRLLIRDILELGVGSIIELEKMAGEPVDLFANGLLIARGEVVVIEDNFGVRVTEIITAADRTAGLKADH